MDRSMKLQNSSPWSSRLRPSVDLEVAVFLASPRRLVQGGGARSRASTSLPRLRLLPRHSLSSSPASSPSPDRLQQQPPIVSFLCAPADTLGDNVSCDRLHLRLRLLIRDSCYGNTMQSDFPVLLDKTCGNLRMSHLAESSDGEQGHPVKVFISPEDIVIIPEYFSSNPERVRPYPMFVDSYNGMDKMVAMFSCHAGAVRGLAFSPHAPSFLISGASQGKIVLWDLAKTFSDTVPTSEFVISNGDLSFVAWSPTIANLIATTTSAGETVVLDLRTKKKTVSHHQIDAVMSTVQWAAFDPNEILTGASQTSSSCLPFNLWDLRKPNEPLKSFGKEISGANYISFCPLDGDKFLASTNEDIYTWSLKDGQINGCVLCGLSCGEVHYRPGSEELLAASTEQGVRAYKWEIIDNTDCPDTIE